MSPGTFVFLLGAGVAAGLSGSIAGLAALFSYPALLATGLPATAANMTNTVALTFSSLGAAAGSRPELAGQAATLGRLALPTAAGGAAGAGLLLLTPPGVFERVVPFLVGGASVVLLLQPRIRAAAATGRPHRGGPAVTAGILAVSVYGGYFGAAAGVLMLALLLVGLPVGLLQGNALKNVLLGLAKAVAAAGFALFGPVDWLAVPPLALGVVLGAYAGPALARRLPATVLRVGIALAGLGLAVSLAVGAF
ncbi:MAG TPA: sulfite exporter TauE/SafE family protein [Pseudonocardia sp.]|nr:sulfite exporter TauE/SafE family protein [Pseudonocardia sp.]